MNATALRVNGSYNTTIIIVTQQLSLYLISIYPSLIFSFTPH